MSRDKNYLVSLKDRRSGFFAWEGIDLEIQAQCIETFIKETWTFFTWLFGELKWKVDDSWQGNKWGLPEPAAETAGSE